MIKCYEIWSNSLVWMCSCLSVGYIKYYKIWWLLKIGYQGYKKYNHSRLPWGKALKQSDDFQAMCEPPANIFAWRPQKANCCDGPGLFWTDKLTLGMANCVFFSSFSIYNFRSDQVWHLPRSSNFKLQISASVLFFFFQLLGVQGQVLHDAPLWQANQLAIVRCDRRRWGQIIGFTDMSPFITLETGALLFEEATTVGKGSSRVFKPLDWRGEVRKPGILNVTPWDTGVIPPLFILFLGTPQLHNARVLCIT